jgi:hypothetical protein
MQLQNGEPLPPWLAAQWEPRIVPILAHAIVRSVPAEKARIFGALDAGATIDFSIDEDGQRVIFGVEGRALVALSFDAITGVPTDGQSH